VTTDDLERLDLASANPADECAPRHFSAIDVDYAVASSVTGMISELATGGSA